MQADLVLQGRMVILRPMIEADIADCGCWYMPGRKWAEFDGPWYND